MFSNCSTDVPNFSAKRIVLLRKKKTTLNPKSATQTLGAWRRAPEAPIVVWLSSFSTKTIILCSLFCFAEDHTGSRTRQSAPRVFLSLSRRSTICQIAVQYCLQILTFHSFLFLKSVVINLLIHRLFQCR